MQIDFTPLGQGAASLAQGFTNMLSAEYAMMQQRLMITAEQEIRSFSSELDTIKDFSKVNYSGQPEDPTSPKSAFDKAMDLQDAFKKRLKEKHGNMPDRDIETIAGGVFTKYMDGFIGKLEGMRDEENSTMLSGIIRDRFEMVKQMTFGEQGLDVSMADVMNQVITDMEGMFLGKVLDDGSVQDGMVSAKVFDAALSKFYQSASTQSALKLEQANRLGLEADANDVNFLTWASQSGYVDDKAVGEAIDAWEKDATGNAELRMGQYRASLNEAYRMGDWATIKRLVGMAIPEAQGFDAALRDDNYQKELTAWANLANTEVKSAGPEVAQEAYFNNILRLLVNGDMANYVLVNKRMNDAASTGLISMEHYMQWKTKWANKDTELLPWVQKVSDRFKVFLKAGENERDDPRIQAAMNDVLGTLLLKTDGVIDQKLIDNLIVNKLAENKYTKDLPGLFDAKSFTNRGDLGSAKAWSTPEGLKVLEAHSQGKFAARVDPETNRVLTTLASVAPQLVLSYLPPKTYGGADFSKLSPKDAQVNVDRATGKVFVTFTVPNNAQIPAAIPRSEDGKSAIITFIPGAFKNDKGTMVQSVNILTTQNTNDNAYGEVPVTALVTLPTGYVLDVVGKKATSPEVSSPKAAVSPTPPSATPNTLVQSILEGSKKGNPK